MFFKIVLGALGIVAALWAMGYDAATIKAAAHRWSSDNASTVASGPDSDWGDGS